MAPVQEPVSSREGSSWRSTRLLDRRLMPSAWDSHASQALRGTQGLVLGLGPGWGARGVMDAGIAVLEMWFWGCV